MLIASIDLQGGQTVQLRRGQELVLSAGDPRPIAKKFAPLGEIAVIDLDAAMGTGSNAELIRELLPLARVRVGGGIRDVETARAWLDAGAHKVILGTAAQPELLRQLPREHVIAALDSKHGKVTTHGWTQDSTQDVTQRVRELAPYVGGFLLTFVEIEGTMGGFDLARCGPLIDAAGPARVTFAGGITTPEQIGALDRLGADAQVGMAIYTGAMDPADTIWARLTIGPDALVPTVITDEHGVALGLAYSSQESLREAYRTTRGVYWSRSRRELWRKGDTSGDTQDLLRIDADCDADCLRFVVRQHGTGNCHLKRHTCWGDWQGLTGLSRRLARTLSCPEPGSYTARLAGDAALLRAKLLEEANELMDAREKPHIAQEAADVLYFTLARLASAGVRLEDVEAALDRRALKTTRRPGDAKPGALPGGGAP